MKRQTAKTFLNGSSQAVRLPKEYRFSSDEIFISREGDNVILSEKIMSWDDFFNEKSVFDDDFLEDRGERNPQMREF
jgi:antitoxin VapB